MITGRGVQKLIEDLEDAGVLIVKPGMLDRWGRKIAMKFPNATDADLARVADMLEEKTGAFVRLGDVTAALEGAPSESDRVDRAARLEAVTSIGNGGPLFPEPDADGRDVFGEDYTRWLEAARSYAADMHAGMTLAQVNAEARRHAYEAIGRTPPPQLPAVPRPLTLPRLRKA